MLGGLLMGDYLGLLEGDVPFSGPGVVVGVEVVAATPVAKIEVDVAPTAKDESLARAILVRDGNDVNVHTFVTGVTSFLQSLAQRIQVEPEAKTRFPLVAVLETIDQAVSRRTLANGVNGAVFGIHTNTSFL